MLNRFKNALYGPAKSADDTSVEIEYDGTFSKKIRAALTRSSSFREDLLSEVTRNRSLPIGSNHANNSNNSNNTTSSSSSGTSSSGPLLQRGHSQILRTKPGATILDEEENARDSRVGRRLLQSYLPDRRIKKSRRPILIGTTPDGYNKVAKFHYTRPEFLQLRTDDEIIVSADHQIRPIILPRDVSRLPWKTGYAECINAGKSLRNEDQAACYQDVSIRHSSLLRDSLSTSIRDQIPWTYFGLFDGHAGTAVAVAAAAQLHNIIGEKLRQVADLLIALEFDLDDNKSSDDDDDDDGDDDDEVDEDDGQIDKLDDDDEFADCASSPGQTIAETKPAADGAAAAAAAASPRMNSRAATGELAAREEASHREEPRGENGDIRSESECDTSKSNDGAPSDETSNKRTPPTTSGGNGQQRPHNDHQQQQPRQRRRRRRSESSELERERLSLPKMVDICRQNVSVDTLIVGTLESAFWEMDAIIASDKHEYKMAGGCTALVSVFILGKLYVCNAGDSRAIVYKNDQVTAMSFDFTPTSERRRILRLGLERPEFLGDEFTHLEFLRRPGRKDLGKQMLYRDAYMTGWSMKTITYDDLKFPLVWGEGKRSRVLATIGVTRGLGDHELKSQFGSVLIKPFLTPEPEVRVLELEHAEPPLEPEDVLIMGSDGLWDVTCNDEAADIVKRSFELFADNEESRSKYRYITAAQDLIIHSRGHTGNTSNVWRTADDRLASHDDISAFVVPLKPYRDEYLEWKRLRSLSPRK